MSESQAQSLPELSLSPFFERQWPSVYEALEDGRINVEQIRAIWVSVLLADRWYGTPEFLRACHELGYSVLIRLKSNRKLYRVPVRRYKRGAPPKDGPLFQGKRPQTHGQADEQWSEEPPEGRQVHISRWNHLHFQQARELDLAVIRVEREAAKGTKRDPRVSWFVMLDQIVPLSQVAQQYRRRFSQEHGYRFLKQALLWTRAHVRTPSAGVGWWHWC